MVKCELVYDGISSRVITRPSIHWAGGRADMASTSGKRSLLGVYPAALPGIHS